MPDYYIERLRLAERRILSRGKQISDSNKNNDRFKFGKQYGLIMAAVILEDVFPEILKDDHA